MHKIRLQISVLLTLLWGLQAGAQENYPLHLTVLDSAQQPPPAIETVFASRLACIEYMTRLPGKLQAEGYVTASLDSVRFDSSHAVAWLFLGGKYQWGRVETTQVEPALLEAAGWKERQFTSQVFDFPAFRNWQEHCLQYLENNGYPFARIWLDSIRIDRDKVTASLRVHKGPLYHIDSIRVFGNAKISSDFLQRYLDIPNGSIYQRNKLIRINQQLRELTYVEEEQPFDITMLGTGSVINLYLRQKKSSQLNALIGLLPNNDQLSSKKMLLTGEANILLKNALGSGETMGLNWQQLQVKSPRLNILYQHPYLMRSPVGLDFSFDMFRKDSSFVNVNLQLGAQYVVNKTQTGNLFIQRFQTIVSEGGIDSAFVVNYRTLPDVADVSSFNVGVDYTFNSTNYRMNPRQGVEFRVVAAAGTKKMKQNNQVTSFKDPADPAFDFARLYDSVKLKTYQLRIRLLAARYFPLRNKRSTVKTAVNAGLFESGSIFRNELFQLGGYKLLRGFDEESQYLSHYAIATAEYRYLVGQNSYFYVLADGGWGRNNARNAGLSYTYIGTGLGLALETGAGIFNLAWAVGKRNDAAFNLRQSKIHFGFVSFF